MTVRQSHEIAHQVRTRILERHRRTRFHVPKNYVRHNKRPLKKEKGRALVDPPLLLVRRRSVGAAAIADEDQYWISSAIASLSVGSWTG